MSTALLMIAALASGSNGVTTDKALDSKIEKAVAQFKACGPRTVWYCLRRLGRDVGLDTISQQANLGPEGTSLADLIAVFQSYEVPAYPVAVHPNDLSSLPAPAILVLWRKHCVVFEGLDVDGKTARYYEPDEGRLRAAQKEVLQRALSGEVIVFEQQPLSVVAFCVYAALGAGSVIAAALGVGAAGRVWRARHGCT